MAKYQGELRDRKRICYAAGCDDLAVHDMRFAGLCILCSKHWDEKFAGGDVMLAGSLEPDPNVKYVLSNCTYGANTPISPGRKILTFRCLPDVKREAKP